MPSNAVAARRTFLFLQGLASPFFWQVATALRGQGTKVLKLCLCPGDRLFWKGPSSSFRARQSDWRDYLDRYLAENEVTDICLFGDMRTYHRVAVDRATAKGITVHVFEEGYLRPNWITLDVGGSNANSSFRFNALSAYAARAKKDALPAGSNAIDEAARLTITPSMVHRVVWDTAYHAANIVGAFLYPHYRHHRPEHILKEAAGWTKRFLLAPLERKRSQKASRRIKEDFTDYFFVPLQLNADSQIRYHSDFDNVQDFLKQVLRSFAAARLGNTGIVVKQHPLDNGIVDWRQFIKDETARLGLDDRVIFIDGGDINELVQRAKGVVVINSTVGLAALDCGTATIALGNTLYGHPGMVFGGTLEEFWTGADTPSKRLVDAYKQDVIGKTQLYGSYFDPRTTSFTARSAAEKLLARAMPKQTATQVPSNTERRDYLTAAE